MWECGKGHFWSSSFIGWQSGEDAVIVGGGVVVEVSVLF